MAFEKDNYGKHGKHAAPDTDQPQNAASYGTPAPNAMNDSADATNAVPAGTTAGRAASDAPAGETYIRVKKKRKQHKGRKTAAIVVGVIVAILAVVGVAAALYLHSIDSAMSMTDDEKAKLREAMLQTDAVEDKSEAFYMLVLGSDAREGDTASRSDVMILLRVDPLNGKVTMVSIPRDTKVEIEGHGAQKINAAYAFGGAAGAVTAVQNMSGVSISHYAEIHFDELETLVDSLGGIWVDVPVSNNQTGSSNSGMRIDAGYQLLNGQQALALARERYGYTRGDFQRADNQKLIAQAIVQKVLDEQPLEMAGSIQKLASCVTTDYAVQDIVALAQQFQSSGVTFYSATVPSTTKTIDGVSYALTIEDEWKQMMDLVKQGKDPSTLDTDSMLANDADASGETADESN